MVSDSIRYEAQPIPPRQPDQGTRWSAILGSIAAIAVLLAGVAFGATLFRGSDEPDPRAQADPTATTLAPRTPTTLGSPLASRDQRAEGRFGYGSSDMASRPYSPDRPAGPPTPPLPVQEFTWEKVTLDLPGSAEAYLQGVYAVDDGFIALGIRSTGGASPELVAWESADGSTWTPARLTGDFTNASVWNVVFTDYGAIAFGEDGRVEPGGLAFREYAPAVRVIWTSRDGVTWTRATLDLRSAANQEVWISSGTAGPDGYIIVGQRSTAPEFQPMIIEKDGYRLELSEYSYTYRVLDAAGTVLVEGSMDDIYGRTYAEDGQAVVDPDTGEVYTIVPFETWEQAWNDAYQASGGGPFGSYGYHPTVVTIEYDGYRIVVDEELSTYRIEDAATGEVLSSGSADYLWRGPAPVITDAAGHELLRFTWQEFDAAQERFWNSQEEYEY